MDRYVGFAEFVAARQMALSRTAYLLTGDHHAAQDLVQSALVRTAAHWPPGAANGDPEAYVRRVMVNENVTLLAPARPAADRQPCPDRPVADESGRAESRLALTAMRCAALPRVSGRSWSCGSSRTSPRPRRRRCSGARSAP